MPKQPKRPTRDLEKYNAWRKESSIVVQFRIANSTGIPRLLEIMTEQTGKSASQYAKEAMLEKLVDDGFMEKPVV